MFQSFLGDTRMKRSYTISSFLVILLLSGLCACNNKSAESPATTKNLPNVTLFVGQVYPNQHVVLQTIATHINKLNVWPETITVYPLYASTKSKETKILRATVMDKLSNVYVPMIENMPDLEKSKCALDGHSANKNYQYLLKDKTLIYDYFTRGMPDNCEKDDNATRYRADSIVLTSYPVIAISGDQNVSLDFQNIGKIRPMTVTEQRQVTQYIKDFKAEFKKAYGSEYDEKTNNIGKIPTLADARILLEAQLGKTGYSIRVSSWERITAAYHIYRVVEASLLKNDELIQTYETSRYQGVLG